MPTVRIITNRLPQPERRMGSELTVSPEKAVSLVERGFAVIIEDAAPVAAVEPARRGRPRKVL